MYRFTLKFKSWRCLYGMARSDSWVRSSIFKTKYATHFLNSFISDSLRSWLMDVEKVSDKWLPSTPPQTYFGNFQSVDLESVYRRHVFFPSKTIDVYSGWQECHFEIFHSTFLFAFYTSDAIIHLFLFLSVDISLCDRQIKWEPACQASFQSIFNHPNRGALIGRG